MKNILVMGDGGTDGKNPYNDLYIIAQSKVKNPRVLFLGTASGDNEGYIKYFMHLFSRYPCEPDYLSLFNPNTKDIKDYILSANIIYVGGGHTRNMLSIWRDWQIDQYLKLAYENETILAGGSAGSVCWFKECITDSNPFTLSVMPCLDILPYSNCPHFKSKNRQNAYRFYLENGNVSDGYANDDGALIHFQDGEFYRAVSNHQSAKAWECSMVNAICRIEKLPTHWLGIREYQEQFIYSGVSFQQ